MADSIDSHNSKIIIDEEVGSGGSYNVNGHNNQMKLKGVQWDEIVIMGHNNLIRGNGGEEAINKLVVLGHNNVIRNLHIGHLEVLGHNNTFKYLNLYKEATNSGFNNKFSECAYSEDAQYEEEEEEAPTDEYYQENYGNTFSFSNGDGHMGIQSQVESMLNGMNLGSDFGFNFNFQTNFPNLQTNIYVNQSEGSSEDSDSSEDSEESEEETERGYEEEKYYDDPQEQDEEADISPEERANIINSINSFSYHPKNKDDEDNCAVCLSKLEASQQVKQLGCKHVFHPKWINSWLKQKLICPCCKAKVTID